MTSGSTHGSIRQPNTIITTAPNILLNLSLVENHNKRNPEQKQPKTISHPVSRRGKIARKSHLIRLCPAGAVTAIVLTKTRI
jgi:hypothetical protein